MCKEVYMYTYNYQKLSKLNIFLNILRTLLQIYVLETFMRKYPITMFPPMCLLLIKTFKRPKNVLTLPGKSDRKREVTLETFTPTYQLSNTCSKYTNNIKRLLRNTLNYHSRVWTASTVLYSKNWVVCYE
jgi:hypothetical protein